MRIESERVTQLLRKDGQSFFQFSVNIVDIFWHPGLTLIGWLPVTDGSIGLDTSKQR